ncbi:endolysin [Arthrobacter phage Hankly]|nr:endolysin [Arthrobacter phage Hankly]
MAAPAATIELFLPSEGPITQGLGVTQKQDGNPHAGTDFAYTANGKIFDKVYAAAEGRVIWASDSRGMGWPNLLYVNPDFDRTDSVDSSGGNYTIIAHYDSFGNLIAYTGYGHQEEIYVKVGDWVRAGQHIGKVGATGFNFGKHLHFDLILFPFDVNDAPFYGRVDPTPYFVNQFHTDEDDMYTQTDRDRDDRTASRVDYLWDQLGPGKAGYKDEGALVKELRDTKKVADLTLKTAGDARKTAADTLFAVTPGVSNQRPAGATILAIMELLATTSGKNVQEIVDGVSEKMADGVEFVLVPKGPEAPTSSEPQPQPAP